MFGFLVITSAFVGIILVGLSICWLPSFFLLLKVACIGIAGFLLLIRPAYGLYIVLIAELVFVGNQDYVTLTKFATFVGLMLVLFRTLLTLAKSPDIWRQERLWLNPLFVFFGLAAFSIVSALAYDVSIMSWAREFFPLLNYGLIVTVLVYMRNQQQLKRFLNFVIIVVSLVVIRDFLSIAGPILHLTVFNRFYYFLTRIFSTPGSPLFSMFILFLGLLSKGWFRNRLARFMLAGVSLLGASVLLLSGTRTYWLGALAALFIWLFIQFRFSERSKNRFARPALIVLLLFATIALFFGHEADLPVDSGQFSLADRLATLNPQVLKYDWSYEARLNETAAAFAKIAENPLLGHGLGYQLTSYARPWVDQEVTRGFLHNSFVYILLKLGAVGLIVFIWFLGAIGMRLWQARRQISSREVQILAPVVLTMFITMIWISLSTAKLEDVPTTLVLSLLIGVVLGIAKNNRQNQVRNVNSRRG